MSSSEEDSEELAEGLNICGVRAEFLIQKIFDEKETVEFYNSTRKAKGTTARNAAWTKIADFYNERFPASTKTVQQIQRWYAKRKSKVKKDESAIKRYASMTGGGIDFSMENNRKKINDDFGVVDATILTMLGRTTSYTGIEKGAESGQRAASRFTSSSSSSDLLEGRDDEGNTHLPMINRVVARVLTPARNRSIEGFLKARGGDIADRAKKYHSLKKQRCLEEDDESPASKKSKVSAVPPLDDLQKIIPGLISDAVSKAFAAWNGPAQQAEAAAVSSTRRKESPTVTISDSD